jgi:hypothetical protein
LQRNQVYRDATAMRKVASDVQNPKNRINEELIAEIEDTKLPATTTTPQVYNHLNFLWRICEDVFH